MNRSTRARTTGVKLAAFACAATMLASACRQAQDATSTQTQGTFAASSGSDDGGTPVAGGKLVFGLAAETNSWSPYFGQWGSSGYLVANAIFDPLVALDKDNTPHPYLAESVTSNKEFTEWTVKLRPNIRFHNAESLDADALKFNFDSARQSGLTSMALATVSSVDVVDRLSVKVTMTQPWSTFPVTLTSQLGYIAAPAMLRDPDGGRKPIGTGPFSFVSWSAGNVLKVKRNSTYWQPGRPYLDDIDFRVLTDATSRGQALEAGDVDIIELNAPEQMMKFQEQANNGQVRMFTNVGGETDEQIIALNTAKPPFDDPIARKALATGLDQDDLSQMAYSGAFPGARLPFARTSPYYVPPSEVGYPDYSTEQARALLEQYKQKHPGETLKFTAIVPADPVYNSIAQALEERARGFGVEVELQQVDQATLIQKVLAGDYQAAGFVLFSTPTLDRAYAFIATPPKPLGQLSLNFTRYEDPEITRAMDEARATDDAASQVEAYKKVQARMASNLDKIFLVHAVSGITYNRRIQGVKATVFPGTSDGAINPTPTSPFLTAAWKKA